MPIDPGHPIAIAADDPENRGVLDCLRRPQRDPARPLSAPPGSFPDPYMELGTHPDIVEQLWDRLGPSLQSDCRCVIAGSPGLADPVSGMILAVGLGTTYALRFAPGDFEAALAAGAETTHHYSSVDEALDVAAWGAGWVFGSWASQEAERLGRAQGHARARANAPWDSGQTRPPSPPAPRG